MIVWRLTSRAKMGCQPQMIEMMKSLRAEFDDPSRVRVYVAHPAGAPAYAVITDIEFESLSGLEQWLGHWFAKPGTAEFLQKIEALRESGGDSTLWNLQ